MIGILTFHFVLNYGAVLQAYGLQHYLKKNGIENEIIDYRCPELVKKHHIRFNIKNPIGYWIKKKTESKFRLFVEKELQRSSCYYSAKDIGEENYDYFLVGSDQVWNPELTNNDRTYLLSFVKDANKKYSYAASMGEYGNDIRQDLRAAIEQFRGLSVREESAGNYIKENMKREDVVVHIDPVLLLEKEEWEKMLQMRKRGRYILVYSIGGYKESINAALKLSKRVGIPVLWLSDSMRRIKGVKQERKCSPQEFVGMFRGAEYVVTNSFHGTMFSVIFQKKFYALTQKEGKGSVRINNALKTLGLEQCIVENIEQELQVDWQLVKSRVSYQRKLAKEYLEILGKTDAKN